MAIEQGDMFFASPRKLGLHEGIVEHLEQLDFEWRCATRNPHMPQSPGDGFELTLHVEFHDILQTRDPAAEPGDSR